MSFAPLAFKLFYAARQNAVLRRSPLPSLSEEALRNCRVRELYKVGGDILQKAEAEAQDSGKSLDDVVDRLLSERETARAAAAKAKAGEPFDASLFMAEYKDMMDAAVSEVREREAKSREEAAVREAARLKKKEAKKARRRDQAAVNRAAGYVSEASANSTSAATAADDVGREMTAAIAFHKAALAVTSEKDEDAKPQKRLDRDDAEAVARAAHAVVAVAKDGDVAGAMRDAVVESARRARDAADAVVAESFAAAKIAKRAAREAAFVAPKKRVRDAKKAEADAEKKREREESEAKSPTNEPSRKKRKEGDIRKRGSGASGFYGVRKEPSGRWRVEFIVDRKEMHVGVCDEKGDAARLVDLISVVANREAPGNFPELFQEWLDAGGHGDVPAELVEAALRRVGDVHVSGAQLRDALAAAEAKIAAAAADPELRPLYFTGLKVAPGADWTLPQAEFLEGCGVITVGDLALLDVDKKEGELANVGRETLWRWKCAAAALLGVDDIGELPKLKKGAPPKQERTPTQQDALDVAARWVAHAGTPDPAFVKDYADALAAIARRQLPKKSSGGDGGAEPPQKKRHC